MSTDTIDTNEPTGSAETYRGHRIETTPDGEVVAWIGGAGVYAEGGHVKNIIRARYAFLQQTGIPDIPFVEFNQGVTKKIFHIGPAAPYQVIQDDDLFWF